MAFVPIVLSGLLLILCVVWLTREAKEEANPSAGRAAGVVPKTDYYMLGAFAVLIVGIALTA